MQLVATIVLVIVAAFIGYNIPNKPNTTIVNSQAKTNNMATPVRTTFNALKEQAQKIYHLNSISSVLAWDEQVMMTPNDKAVDTRGQQKGVLSGITHEFATSETLSKLLKNLDKFESESELNEFEKGVVRLQKRDFAKRTKIPKALVEEQAELESKGYAAWVTARKESNFAKFSPILTRWIEIKKEVASKIDSSKPAYDVLMDEFERGVTSQRLDEIFAVIKAKLIPLIKKIVDKSATDAVDSGFLYSTDGSFPIKQQEQFNRQLAQSVGYSFKHGRLDVSVHPFSIGISPYDVRITTRYDPNEFVQGLAGTIHESGHAIYEQSLNEQYFGLNVAQSLGMGLHESQSLLYERHVGLSKPFWQFAWPLAQEAFPHLKQVTKTPEQVYNAINEVKPIFIRVESDEVTYPLHIILRYELEKGIFNGTYNVDDLPQLWNAKMQEYLGIVPPTDAQGVLQDVHWSGGAFAYFPTYLLGQCCAAQLFAAAKKQIPNLEANFAKGEFAELKAWLNKNVHTFGSLYNIDELMLKATGEGINPTFLIDYLEDKYKDIYKL